MHDLFIAPFADFGFMKRALVACLCLSLGGSSIGVFLILRRMSLMGDALAHALLPGDLRAARQDTVAGRVFEDRAGQHIDAAEARVAHDRGGNAHRLLAEDHAGRLNGIAADIE